MFQCLINPSRRVAVLVDENPRYRRLLMLAPGGLDILKFTPEAYRVGGWRELAVEHGAVKFALTHRPSFFSKTERASRALKEILMELKGMGMKDLMAEHVRLTGRSVVFASKAKAIAAIEKASAARPGVNSAADPVMKKGTIGSTTDDVAAATADSAANDTADPATTPESDMTKTAKTAKTKSAAKPAKTTKPAKPAKTTKPAKPAKPAKAPRVKKTNGEAPSRLERAKKVAKMVNGSGGMIVKLLKEGKLDDDSIISKVLKDFPDRAVNNAQVAWYRSMLTTAGAIK